MSFRRLFARFALSGLVAMLIVGAVGFVVVRRSATAGAIRQATDLSDLAGRGIVEPLITPGVLRGDPSALARLDAVVRQRILGRTPIVRVKIWDSSGRIIYSDARSLIGARYPLGAAERHTLRTGGSVADASDLARPENQTERQFKRLLEVYAGIRAPSGTPLLYEDYERSSTISASSRRQWIGLVPPLIGVLLVLYLVQVPLAYSLARRLREKQREREQLLRRAIEASDLERRRIAADLHDGAVQRLTGVSLSLAASAAQNGETARPGAARSAMVTAAAETRETIRELRTLLVDIYPPTLQQAGLAAALSDLVAPLRTAGIRVVINVPDDLRLPEDVEALLYRVAQEAVRNIRAHSQATRVEIDVSRRANEASLSIRDDGTGFAAGSRDEAADPGHLGMRLMSDLADHAGGRLDIVSAPGQGVSVQIEVPLL
ncbi:MAG TPA: sensor histidine kinase [Solirubrobacteraceae bacterium]|nr:sensor histidine kinase [Solirubrobacteraceae bacterium]